MDSRASSSLRRFSSRVIPWSGDVYKRQILDTSEIYYGLSGHGMMLMETPEGQVDWKEIGPGEALYVPGRWAHRSINTGTEPLVMFFVYRGDAGHDYGTIEEKGYRKLVVERDGRPAVIDNPKWKV